MLTASKGGAMSSTTIKESATLAGVRLLAHKRRDWLNIVIPLAPIMIFYLIFLVYPIVVLGHFSLQEENGRLGLQNYVDFFTRATLRRSLANTLTIAGAATLLDLILGYPVAYYLARRQTWVADLLQISLLIPLYGGLYVAFAFMLMLLPNGFLNSVLALLHVTEKPLSLLYTRPTLIAAFGIYGLPFMVYPLRAAIQGIDPALEEAARTLGASGWEVLRRILLPMSAIGMVGGVLLNFGWNVAIFSIPLVLSFKGAPFLSIDIYFSTRYGIRWSYAATLSAVLFVITFGLSYLYMVLVKPTTRTS
jgi:putative spermidine/putrescine transport system permease protein